MTVSSNNCRLADAEIDHQHMQRALQLARQGEGHVEPNPMVGCVIAIGERILAEGWHRTYGKAHAEVDALQNVDAEPDGLASASLYVTLEPCCHTAKTPPCTEAILNAGIRRVVVAVEDPFPAVSGRGVEQLRESGVQVVTGICEAAGRQLLAPYLKLQQHNRPWIIAKWAMTLDGKMATCTGSSQWISNDQSRAAVHQLRGRVDAVLVGSRTAILDNPQLTARPAGPRTPLRVVFDSQAQLAEHLPDCQLARTIANAPVVVFTSEQAPPERIAKLVAVNFEVFTLASKDRQGRVVEMLDELGRRDMTNVLVEGGAGLLGALMDAGEIDEAHAFIAPKIVGGQDAPSPILGRGISLMGDALPLLAPKITTLDDNVYIHGRLRK